MKLYLTFLLLSIVFAGCNIGANTERKNDSEIQKDRAIKSVTKLFDSALTSGGGKLDDLSIYKFENIGDSFLLGFNAIGSDNLNREIKWDSVEMWVNKYYRIIGPKNGTILNSRSNLLKKQVN